MYNIRMKVGGNIYPVTEKLLKHNEAEVVVLNNDGTLRRVVDPTEYADLTVAEMNAEPEMAKVAPDVAPKVVSKKKSSKKKVAKAPEPDAPELESIDVSSL